MKLKKGLFIMSYYKNKEEFKAIKETAEHIYLLFYDKLFEEYTGFQIVNRFAKTVPAPEGIHRKFEAEGNNIYQYFDTAKRKLFATFESKEEALLAYFDLNIPQGRNVWNLPQSYNYRVYHDTTDVLDEIKECFEVSPDYCLKIIKALALYVKKEQIK